MRTFFFFSFSFFLFLVLRQLCLSPESSHQLRAFVEGEFRATGTIRGSYRERLETSRKQRRTIPDLTRYYVPTCRCLLCPGVNAKYAWSLSLDFWRISSYAVTSCSNIFFFSFRIEGSFSPSLNLFLPLSCNLSGPHALVPTKGNATLLFHSQLFPPPPPTKVLAFNTLLPRPPLSAGRGSSPEKQPLTQPNPSTQRPFTERKKPS